MASKTIWRLPIVISRTGLSRSSIYQKIKDGIFPEPINLGPRAVGWLAEDINDWVDERVRISRQGGQQ